MKKIKRAEDFIGGRYPTLHQLEELDINFHIVALDDQDKCIHCGRLLYARGMVRTSRSTCPRNPYNTYTVKEENASAAISASWSVPSTSCITMVEQRKGEEYLN